MPTTVTYVHAAGGTQTIKGIFDEAYTEVIVNGDGTQVQSVSPMLGVRNADLTPKPAKGDRCNINGVWYRVIERRPDGEAGSELILHKD